MIVDARMGLDQRTGKCSTKYSFLFYSWYYSNRSYEASRYVVFDFIGLVKTKKWVFVRHHQKYEKGMARRFLPGVY